MLAEMYINALGALKAQSEGRSNDVKRLAQGCEVEAGHIYRIMHAHNTNIVEMNEELLERFMAEEIASGSPYPSPDRDGLQFVDLEQDVEVYPCIMRGCVTSPIDNESYTLAAHEAIAMLALLRRMKLWQPIANLEAVRDASFCRCCVFLGFGSRFFGFLKIKEGC